MDNFVSIRGAISVKDNTITEIKKSVNELLNGIVQHNKLDTSKIINIIFTVTHDLNAIHPATVAREDSSFANIPMLCTQEMKVPTDLPKCIRVMIQISSSLKRDEVKHIYLGEAAKLRPDLKI